MALLSILVPILNFNDVPSDEYKELPLRKMNFRLLSKGCSFGKREVGILGKGGVQNDKNSKVDTDPTA